MIYHFILRKIFLKKKQVDSSTYNIQTPRLSTNAFIQIKVWIKDKNQPLSVIYADDYNSRQLNENDSSSELFLTIKIVMIVIIFLSLAYLIISIVLKVPNYLKKIMSKQVYDILGLIDEKEAEKEIQDEITSQHEQVSEDVEETKNKLKRLIRKVKEN